MFFLPGQPCPSPAEEPKERAAREGHTKVVSLLAVTDDGKLLATASYDGTVKLWDLTTGKELTTFSPDGKTLASGGWGGKVKLWEAETGNELASFTANDDRVHVVAFTADSKTLVSGGGIQFERGEAKVWDLAEIMKLRRDK